MKSKNGKILWEYFLFLLLFLLLTGGLLAFLTYLKTGNFRPVDAVAEGEENPPFTVVLDAGHGGEDGGASGKAGGETVLEKNLNLDIALRLRDLLLLDGVRVVMTREEDVLLYDRNTDYTGRKKVLDLAARLALTEKTENPLFVSIHMNAYPQPQYAGLQVWYAPGNSASRQFAETIQSRVRESLQPENSRQVKAADSAIFLLDNMTCPAVLVECGFLSNPTECALLADGEYRQKLALLLWQGIREGMQNAENLRDAENARTRQTSSLIKKNANPLDFGAALLYNTDRIKCPYAREKDGKMLYEGYESDLCLLLLLAEKPQMVGQVPFLRRVEFLC